MKHYITGGMLGTRIQASVEFKSKEEAEIMQPLFEKHKILTETIITVIPYGAISQSLLGIVIKKEKQSE